MRRFLLWLLVFLLPLIGLANGLLLMPAHSTSWQVSYGSSTNFFRGLGFADNGKTILIAETDDSGKRVAEIGNDGRWFATIIGLDSQTGEKLFVNKLPEEMMQGGGVYAPRLSDDGSIILFCRLVKADSSEKSYYEVLLYDWLQQRITRRYRSKLSDGPLNFPRMSGSTVVAIGEGHSFLIWHGDTEEPFVMKFGDSAGGPGLLHGVSQDGEIACISHMVYPDCELLLIDVKQQRTIQTLKSKAPCVGAYWSSDHTSFIAVDVGGARRYVLKDGTYVLEESFVTVKDGQSPPARQSSPYFAVETSTKDDPWRIKLVSFLDKNLQFIIQRIWPERKVLQLHDTSSGKVMHQVKLPPDWPGFLPHPNGQSLVLFNGNGAALLDIDSGGRWWYPFGGCVVGIVLAAYVVRKYLRQPPSTTMPLANLSPNRER